VTSQVAAGSIIASLIIASLMPLAKAIVKLDAKAK
jgi:hypothetical protein